MLEVSSLAVCFSAHRSHSAQPHRSEIPNSAHSSLPDGRRFLSLSPTLSRGVAPSHSRRRHLLPPSAAARPAPPLVQASTASTAKIKKKGLKLCRLFKQRCPLNLPITPFDSIANVFVELSILVVSNTTQSCLLIW